MPTLVNPPQEISQAGALVAEVLAESQSMAQESMTRGLAAIQALATVAVDIPAVAAPDFTVPVIDMPVPGTAPADPGILSEAFPDLPAAPQAVDIGSLDVGEPPGYDLAAPVLADIALPNPLDVVVPLAPVIADVATPAEPDFTLPAVPTFIAINLPAAPTFDVPLFTDTLDDAPSAPEAQLVWAEVAYASESLAALNDRLLTFVQGTRSALPPEVEAALVQRSVDEQAQAAIGAIDSAMNDAATRGFALAGGQVVRAVQTAVAAGIDKVVQVNRQTLTEQWKLEQANFHFAFTSAVQLETALIDLFNKVQERALDAAKFRADAQIQLFNARVQLYQADVQAFGAQADVFKTRLQAALAQLEIYKAELEGVKARGELNVQLAQQYSAQVEAVQTLAEVYKARVQAVTLAVQTNTVRTERYRAEVEAAAQVAKASASQVRGYVAQIQGEEAKVAAYAATVSGYASRVDAFRALTDAKLTAASLDFRQLQEFPVEVYKGEIDAFAAQVAGETARLTATADLFTARVEGFAATERVAARDATAQAQAAATTTRLYASRAQLDIQAATVNAQLAQTRAQTAQAALRAAGQLSTQLASAAMSARNVSASLSGTTGNTAGMSVTNGTAVSGTNNTSRTSSFATNRSSTNSVNVGGGTTITEAYNMSDNQTMSDTIDQSVYNQTTHGVTNATRREVRNVNETSLNWRASIDTQDIYIHRA